MGKNPSFPFYPGDWTRDLDDHPLEVEGAWVRICCRLWWSEKRGESTKTLREWARILRKTERKTLKILQILIEKHIASGSVLDNQNVTIISRRMVRYDKISQIRQEVGKLGGNPALLKTNIILDNQTPNQKRPSSFSSSFSSSNNKKPPTPLKGGEVILPEWLNQEAWKRYLEHRILLKSKMTDYAQVLAIKHLEEFKKNNMDPVAIINQSIENGWKGLFELKEGISNQEKPRDWICRKCHKKVNALQNGLCDACYKEEKR